MAVPTDPYFFALLADIVLVFDGMVITEMVLKEFAAEEEFGALVYSGFGDGFVTAVAFELVVLGILVAFPIVFAAEGARAGRVCTAPRAFVTFHVFSVGCYWERCLEEWVELLEVTASVHGFLTALAGKLLSFVVWVWR